MRTENRSFLPFWHLFFRLEACTKLLSVILGGSKELWYHSPLCLNTEKNLARGKVREKWFIRIGHLWALQAGRQEDAAPWELTGLQVYNQKKSGVGEEELLCLSWVDSVLPSSAPPPGCAGEFSWPHMVKQGPPIVFYVCRDHALGITNLTELTGQDVGLMTPDQGLYPCPLHCKADSSPLDHQRSP